MLFHLLTKLALKCDDALVDTIIGKSLRPYCLFLVNSRDRGYWLNLKIGKRFCAYLLSAFHAQISLWFENIGDSVRWLKSPRQIQSRT